GGSLAVVIADLDDFKRLNDTRGHAAGDAVLREFADLLRGTLRASDVAARWGGEEFVLLLRETGLGGAGELAERIRSALAARAILNESVAVSRPAGIMRLYDCSRARGVSVPRYVTISAGGGGGGGAGARAVSVPGASTRPYCTKPATGTAAFSSACSICGGPA